MAHVVGLLRYYHDISNLNVWELTPTSLGVLKCYIGSAALRYGQRLNSVTTKKKWPGWIEDVSNTISDDVQGLIGGGVDEVTAKSWKTVVTGVAACLAAAKNLRDALSGLIRGDPERATPAQATVDRARRLLDALDKFVKNDEGPGLPAEQDTASLTKLAAECEAFTGGANKEKKLQEAIDAVLLVATALTPSALEAPQLKHQLASFLANLRNFVEREPQLFIDQTCELAGGKGGAGGSGTTPDLPSGKRGLDKPDKSAEGCLVSLSGTSTDCKIDQAIACPEQCQMILDAADTLYFTNDRSKFPAAMQKYTTLTRRLGFLDVLLKDKDSKEAPLAKALKGLERDYSLTIATLPQLDRIYQTALRRLNGMVYNQDIWGHSDVWVPRLSLAYYGDRVKDMINEFKDLEKTFHDYAKMQQKDRMTENQVSQAQMANGAMAQAARDQTDSIMKHGGELQVASDEIALCRAPLVAARQKLSAALESLREAIQSHFSISADTFMDALSTLSMAPEGFTAIVQAADVAYKSWTKIEDAQGNLVKKSYVVQQVKTCQGTLASLATTFENLDASELTVDDPGYAKVFATAEDVKKILDDFGEQVPTANVRTQLDAFLAVVTRRNTAVIHYNSLIQTYLRLQSIIKACESESRELGEHALSLNPSLPAIYFWLKRLKGQTHLQILQKLNDQARALSFWGPMPVDSVKFAPPGPLDGFVQLRLHRQTLIDLFEKSYEGFQSGGWFAWPNDNNFLGEGIRVPLSDSVIHNLVHGESGHQSLLTISPNSHTDFIDMANVRVTQVRVWLLNAVVASPAADNPKQRQALRIEITHCGDETVWTPDGSPCHFRHAPVTMQFSYETTVFNASGGQCSGRPNLVYGRQDIEHDYAGGPSQPGVGDKPPIGPFGDWKIEVRKDVNPGLDLSRVKTGWIEFCGRNKVATAPLKGL